jgi:acetyl esterase/lipase
MSGRLRHKGEPMKRTVQLLAILLVAVIVQQGDAQVWQSARWEKRLKERYDAHLNLVYSRVDTIENKLDLYVPRGDGGPFPTLIWIHGGGWGRLSKDSVSGQIIPYLEAGWVVANVDYRLTPQARAPAAVIDCRCALHWIADHAGEFKVDTKSIVVSGSSAGGHLALMTGMVPDGSPFDAPCGGEPNVGVVAIVNFYGITDLVDLLDHANRRGYAVKWLGEAPDREELARSVSPMTYVRGNLPPVFTVHGDDDPTVPYEHAVRLHKALAEAGVPNELLTVPGGKHGKFEKEENVRILHAVAAFLRGHGITTREGKTIEGFEE